MDDLAPPRLVWLRRSSRLLDEVRTGELLASLGPLPDGSVDLILNRHGRLIAPEVRRVLCPGGVLLTQQLGSEDCADLNEMLTAPRQVDHMAGQRSASHSATRTTESAKEAGQRNRRSRLDRRSRRSASCELT
jgi:hypothetical protein